MTNNELEVKGKFPKAIVCENNSRLGYFPFEVFDGKQYLGGGRTSDEAWQNAWVHHIYRGIMDRDESEFIVLKYLVTQAKVDSENLGSYMLRAYLLGKGNDVHELMLPLQPNEKTTRLNLFTGESL